MNRFAICFGLIGACVMAVPSQATVTIVASPQTISETNIGPSFSFTRRYFGYINDVRQPGLTANVVFTLTAVENAGRRWVFSAEITNTTSVFTSATLGLFGMSTDNASMAGSQVLGLSSVTTPTATAFNVRNWNNTTGFTVPDLSPNVQFCFKTGGTAGECDTIGASGGITKGNSLTQNFTLNFAAAPGVINLENFVARFRDVSGNARDANNDLVAVSNFTVSAAGEVVPEPSSWAMMIAGFGLVGAMRRRQQRAVATKALASF